MRELRNARNYLDDIIVFTSSSWQEPLDHIRNVFRRIRDAGVKLNRDKCQIGSAILEFLGHKIGMGRVEPSGLRVNVMLDFPRPSDQKQVQSFSVSPDILGDLSRHMEIYHQICQNYWKKGRFTVVGGVREGIPGYEVMFCFQTCSSTPNYQLSFSIVTCVR